MVLAILVHVRQPFCQALASDWDIIDNVVVCSTDMVFTRPVFLGHQARFMAVRPCRIVFEERVEITSGTWLFGPDIQVDFESGTVDVVRPEWFGCSGRDRLDDTEAMQRALGTCARMMSTVTLELSVGRYFISSPLILASQGSPGRTINLRGGGKSNNSIEGASLAWTGVSGETMVTIRNLNQFIIEGLDFTSEPDTRLVRNILFEPFVHQVLFRNCTFTGVSGEGSANVSLNEGNGDQVSEIRFENCSFNGLAPGTGEPSASAVAGGLANTKNFGFSFCAFSAYAKAAIDIHISDVVEVVNCTFANNELDIACGLCGLRAESNYSEHSRAFFAGNASSNIAFTTLVNNRFFGEPRDGFAIRDGAGSLVMINNDFGGADHHADINHIRWDDGNQSSIYSVGNFFKNASRGRTPFYNRSGQSYMGRVTSFNDRGGLNGPTKYFLDD